MVMKPGKILCCMFSFVILEFDPKQNLAKKQKAVMCVHTTNQQSVSSHVARSQVNLLEQIKRQCLHKKRVELPQDWFGAPTWLPFHRFETPIWLP